MHAAFLVDVAVAFSFFAGALQWFILPSTGHLFQSEERVGWVFAFLNH